MSGMLSTSNDHNKTIYTVYFQAYFDIEIQNSILFLYFITLCRVWVHLQSNKLNQVKSFLSVW